MIQLKYFQKKMKLLNQTKYQILMKKLKFFDGDGSKKD